MYVFIAEETHYKQRKLVGLVREYFPHFGSYLSIEYI